MAINKNHEFEDLNGIKCAIVEKNVSQQRADFLKELLEINDYTVMIVPSAPPKVTAPPKPVIAPVERTEGIAVPLEEVPSPPPPPATFTIGVSDVRFNAINAIFGRLLKTKEGNVVTLAYWHQKEDIAHDEIPYYERKM